MAESCASYWLKLMVDSFKLISGNHTHGTVCCPSPADLMQRGRRIARVELYHLLVPLQSVVTSGCISLWLCLL